MPLNMLKVYRVTGWHSMGSFPAYAYTNVFLAESMEEAYIAAVNNITDNGERATNVRYKLRVEQVAV